MDEYQIQQSPVPESFAGQIGRSYQIKAMGWILALLVIIFIILVGTTVFLNLSSQKETPKTRNFGKTQSLPKNPTTPNPQIPESKFNLGP